jgi:hypothetical protein
VWAWAAPAFAYEDQASIDAALAYGHAVSDETPAHGVGLGLGASLGLNNVFTLRGRFAWALHPGEQRTSSVLSLSAEVLYLVDVLEIVPYFGAGIDGLGRLDDSFSADLGIHPIVGFDWLLSREWTLGMLVRSIFLLTALDTHPVYLELGVSASYVIDLF